MRSLLVFALLALAVCAQTCISSFQTTLGFCNRYVSSCSPFSRLENTQVITQEALYKNGTDSYILEYTSLISGDKCSNGMDLSFVVKKSILGNVDNTQEEHTYNYQVTDVFLKTNDINYMLSAGWYITPMVERNTLFSFKDATAFTYYKKDILSEVISIIGTSDSIIFRATSNEFVVRKGTEVTTYTADGNNCDATQYGFSSEDLIVTWIWCGVAIFVVIMIIYVIVSTWREAKLRKNI